MTSAIIIPYRVPAILRLLGARDRWGKNSYRMRWGELSFKRGWAVALCLFEDHFSLHLHILWVNAFIRLGFLSRWHREPHEMLENWGATCSEGALHLCWGRRTKIFWLPWRHWVQVANDVRRPDGTWTPYVGSWEDKEPDGRHVETYPYRHVLRSGEVQNVNATICVRRGRRKLRIFRWLPFARTDYSIDVSFDAEVGERAGSWKGGCIGCSYTLRPDETARECLLRMQEERKF